MALSFVFMTPHCAVPDYLVASCLFPSIFGRPRPSLGLIAHDMDLPAGLFRTVCLRRALGEPSHYIGRMCVARARPSGSPLHALLYQPGYISRSANVKATSRPDTENRLGSDQNSSWSSANELCSYTATPQPSQNFTCPRQ